MKGTVEEINIRYFENNDTILRERWVTDRRAWIIAWSHADAETAVRLGLVPRGLEYLSRREQARGLYEPLVYEVIRSRDHPYRSHYQEQLRHELVIARAEIREVYLP